MSIGRSTGADAGVAGPKLTRERAQAVRTEERGGYMSKTLAYSHYIYTLSHAADMHSYINIGKVYRQSMCLCLYTISDYENLALYYRHTD